MKFIKQLNSKFSNKFCKFAQVTCQLIAKQTANLENIPRFCPICLRSFLLRRNKIHMKTRRSCIPPQFCLLSMFPPKWFTEIKTTFACYSSYIEKSLKWMEQLSREKIQYSLRYTASNHGRITWDSFGENSLKLFDSLLHSL